MSLMRLNCTTILWKILAVIVGSFLIQTASLFQPDSRVLGPERLQRQPDGISASQLSLIRVMGSCDNLAGPTNGLNEFLGPIRQRAAISYFGRTAYFRRHSRWPIFANFTHQSAQVDVCYFRWCPGWGTAPSGCRVWIWLGFVRLL